ncbi:MULTISPECIES: hypothetical protein [Providencia]|uniref:hypothetical protein n=1 Tax=Providencia TaxID=586 RepID=UPI00234B59B5|nr:hypothetical protein [Providencia sp. PROV205]
MAKNEFLPFGIAEGANVLSNQEYERLAARFNGFISGVAKSKELNTVWRQSSVMSSALAQFIVDSDNKDLLDNGDVASIKTRLVTAIKQTISGVGYVTSAAMNLELNKKIDKASISGQKGNDNDKVPSLNLFTTEVGKLAALGYSYSKTESDGKYQPKGSYAPAGDYATNTALANGLNLKFDKNSVTQTSGTSTTQVPSVNAVTIWMEDRYSKAASDARYFPKTGGVLNGSLNATSLSVKTLADTVNFYAPNSAALMGYFQYNEGSNWGGRVQIPRLPLNAIETILHSGNVKQSLGDSTSDVLSQNAASIWLNTISNRLIGFGQKYSNVTQSRSKSTKYVNTTGKPITVLISAFYLGSGSGITAVLQVDGVDFNFRSGGTGADNSYKGLSITAIIPEGSSYMLTSALGTIESWVELR